MDDFKQTVRSRVRRICQWCCVVKDGLIVLLCVGLALAAIWACFSEASMAWAQFTRFGVVAVLVWLAGLAFLITVREACGRIVGVGRALVRFSRNLVKTVDDV